MRLTTAPLAARVAVLAITLATVPVAAGAQGTISPAPAAATVASGRTPIAAVTPTTRVRLVTFGLPADPGPVVTTSPHQRLLVGTLVRIDSQPSLSYVLRTEKGEWSVPRTAVASAQRQVGTSSAGRGAMRSLMWGALIGSGSAWITAKRADRGEENWGSRLALHMGIGAGLGFALLREGAREDWEELALPTP